MALFGPQMGAGLGRRPAPDSGARPAWLRAVVLAALAVGAGGTATADPLDRITGTEGWQQRAETDVVGEWRQWYRARAAWRQARRELQRQRARNRRLARLLDHRRPDGKSRHVLFGRSRRRRAQEPVRVPVERLDRNGQAIDEEGDRVLEQTTRKRAR